MKHFLIKTKGHFCRESILAFYDLLEKRMVAYVQIFRPKKIKSLLLLDDNYMIDQL